MVQGWPMLVEGVPLCTCWLAICCVQANEQVRKYFVHLNHIIYIICFRASFDSDKFVCVDITIIHFIASNCRLFTVLTSMSCIFSTIVLLCKEGCFSPFMEKHFESLFDIFWIFSKMSVSRHLCSGPQVVPCIV